MQNLRAFRDKVKGKKKTFDLAPYEWQGQEDERFGPVPWEVEDEGDELNLRSGSALPELPPLSHATFAFHTMYADELVQAIDEREALQQRYEYVPLNNPNDIRVVRIQQYPTATIPLGCTLQTLNAGHTSLFGAYEAVSYVWGPADLSMTLIVDHDSHLRISATLHDVLRRLVEFYSSCKLKVDDMPPIWIDALCIDQHNDTERSSQVQQMAAIYRRAERVHVFLTDNSQSDLWYDSAWWTRRWVVQEFLAARDVLLHYFTENKSARIGDFATTPWHRFSYPATMSTSHMDPTKRAAFTALRDLKNSGLRLYGIFSLLTKFQLANCLDDRDRLFAFFGIANDVAGHKETAENHPGLIKFDVDYNLSVVQVYLTFAQAALRTRIPFDTLHCAGAFRAIKTTNLSPEKQPMNLSQDIDLPSWVPDWRQPSLWRPLMNISSFKAGVSKPRKAPSVSISNDNRTILIRGIQVTTVLSVGFKYPSLMNGPLTTIDQFEQRGIADGRIGIMTKLGAVGLAPRDVLPGDTVVIFGGARTPFLLRRAIEDSSKTPEYELVGDCSVDGLMQGEIHEDESHPRMDFTIR